MAGNRYGSGKGLHLEDRRTTRHMANRWLACAGCALCDLNELCGCGKGYIDFKEEAV